MTTLLTGAATTFKDIFQSDFLDKVSSFSILDTIIALVLALALGLFIFLVYKKTFNGVMYSASFGLSLVAMTLITTVIILAVTSNVILSLGMVGALSIVRFRSAIKEPIDIAFLFWSISAGIILGAGLIPLAIISCIFIGVMMIIFVNRKAGFTPYMLVVNLKGEKTEQAVMDTIAKSAQKHLVKSKSITPNAGMELSIEVRLKEMSTGFVNDIAAINGVTNAVLVTYNGEYMN